MATGGDAVTLSTTLGRLGPVADNKDGTCTATFTAPAEEGVAIVRGTLNGAPIVDDAPVVLGLGR